MKTAVVKGKYCVLMLLALISKLLSLEVGKKPKFRFRH